MWKIYIMECYLAVKNETIGKWMELKKKLILSEATQTSEDEYCMFPLLCGYVDVSFQVFNYVCYNLNITEVMYSARDYGGGKDLSKEEREIEYIVIEK